MINRLKPQVRLNFVPCKTMQILNTEQAINDHINSLCLQKRHQEAIEAFNFATTKNTHVRIRPNTYARLVCACSSLRSLDHAKRIHAHMVDSKCRTDIVLNNHVINMYGKCGSSKDALKMFDEMPERNAVSWTSLISGFSQNGEEDRAVDFYSRMWRSGIAPDEFTFGSIVKACSVIGSLTLARQIHAHVVIQSGAGDRIVAQNALIASYTKFGRIADAFNVFSGIETRDLVSWGSMISGFSQLGYELEALSQFKEMLCRGGFRPNEFIFGSAFSACSGLVEPELGTQIHGLCVKHGLGRDVFAGCSLCDMYAKTGFLGSARSVFSRIDCPDLVSWNAIIAGFANIEDPDEAVSFFARMRCAGLRPNDVTFLSLLSACSNRSAVFLGREIHCCVIKSGFDLNVTVCNALLTMYAKCSALSEAFKLFECMRSCADLVSWNAILTACAHHDEARDIFRLFRAMLLSQIRPDHISLSNLISACSVIASPEIGDQVHSFSTKTGLSLNISVANSLIDMYTKCGALDSARKLFYLMECPDVVSWSSLIVGYAQFGDGREALELFAKMKGLGVKLNEVTLVGVLTACSHMGLVEEGRRIFSTMESEHGISPTREHCSCMVNLLARSGRLSEAEDFVDKMAFEPDVVVWKTLLAASRTCANVEIGKRAAENIIRLDPTNSAAHVLLSGIHASSGSWEDVARLRGLMRERGVRKVPGQSWIEIKGRTHAFLAEDTLHPERDRVYATLDELWLLMSDEGCDLLEEP